MRKMFVPSIVYFQYLVPTARYVQSKMLWLAAPGPDTGGCRR